MRPGLVLALDSGSPLVSVALGRGGEVLAAREEAIARSSRRLLAMVDEVLAEVGVEREVLEGIVALRGPGSFTGLRVGLATALGLHMALRVPATALPTLQVLAAAAGKEPGKETRGLQDAVVLAAVDALRGEWTVQPHEGEPPRPLGEAETLPAAAIAARLSLRSAEPATATRLLRPSAGSSPQRPVTLIGFGVSALAATPGWPAAVRLVEPGPLALVVLRLLPYLDLLWDAALLTDPIYSRPPAVTTPRRPPALTTAPEPAGR